MYIMPDRDDVYGNIITNDIVFFALFLVAPNEESEKQNR